MKLYSAYQYLKGTPMTDRDKKEVGSKFWNEGKWENFVVPFLPEKCEGQTLVDMGCNAGLFLKLAEDKGFKAIGVDNFPLAVKRGLAYRDSIGYHYKILNSKMEYAIDELPVTDYTVLANAHYYFYIADWLNYIERLANKTRYVIIVTGEKRNTQPSLASADLEDIRSYFRDWDEMGTVTRSPEGDPAPRKLTGICFKSHWVESLPIHRLNRANNVQEGFWEDLDKGIDYHKTRYYKIIKHYRKEWSKEKLEQFFVDKAELLPSVREHGLLEPIIIRKDYRVLDGNHRVGVLKYFGYKRVLVRII